MCAGAAKALACAAILLLAACGAPLTYDDPLPPEIPTRAAISSVPLIEQADFYCGPASLAMVMQAGGLNVGQDELAAMAFTPGAEGAYRADMIGTARRQGQLAVTLTRFDDLLEEVAAGNPVIVFQNLGLGFLPRWHYGVVVGYDRAREEMYLHSGQLSRLTMEFPVFERTWRRGEYWALVVLPPDRFPVTSRELDVLRAGSALERVGRLGEAQVLYQTGAEQWPENWLWPFGLGNARYSSGDLAGAARAYRRAIALEPEASEARTNLRTVEDELG
jgi:hypothetical protein